MSGPTAKDLVGATNDARTRNELVQALALLRESTNQSQEEMARRIGVPPDSVSELEAGNIDPRLSMLQRYARALDTHLSVALDPSTDPFDDFVRDVFGEGLVRLHGQTENSVPQSDGRLVIRHHNEEELTEIPFTEMTSWRWCAETDMLIVNREGGRWEFPREQVAHVNVTYNSPEYVQHIQEQKHGTVSGS